MFYNIQNNNAPRYLCGLIPPTIQSTTVYPLRINPSLRNVESIAKFKSELRKQKDIRQVPKHYEIGPRTLNIALTQLRCFASFLNYDLFQVNIVSDPSCRCGANREDLYHLFCDCSHYANMRNTLFHNLSWLPNDCGIDLKLLTSGNLILSTEQNKIILKHMFEYIKRSERFLV
jgi:hypothetical protein